MNMSTPQQKVLTSSMSLLVVSPSCRRKRRRTDDTKLQRRMTTIVSLVSLTAATVFIATFAPSLVGAFSTPTAPLRTAPQMSSSIFASQHSTNTDTQRPVRMKRRGGKIVPSSSTLSNFAINKPLPTTTLDKSRTSQQLLQRLSVQEQQELFHHVVESRRIRKVELQLEQDYYESQVPITIDRTETSSSSVSMPDLAISTGYGSNVNELQTALIVGQQAREKLITTNMGLVHYCVQDVLKSRTLRSITTDDLVQEGALGLSRAVDKYNPSFYAELHGDKNSKTKIIPSTYSVARSTVTPPVQAKFSTYAVYWIRSAILRTISERDDIMRVPEHITSAIRKISNVANTHGYQLEQDESYDRYDASPLDSATASLPTEELEKLPSTSLAYWSSDDMHREDMKQMIADQTGYSDQMVQNAIMVRNRRNKYSSTVLSYESWMQQGKNYETDITTMSSSSWTFDEPTPNMDHMKQTLSRFLRPKEMEALSWRYGLNDHDDSNPLAKRNYVAEAELKLFGTTEPPPNQGLAKKNKNNDATMIVKGKWGEAMSFNDVGKQMQVSAEYGRRLCHGALQKLRRAVDDGRLEPALLY